jgi:hypothetical protein
MLELRNVPKRSSSISVWGKVLGLLAALAALRCW